MVKECRECNEIKDESVMVSGRSFCLECQRNYSREHYKRNKEYYKRKSKKRDICPYCSGTKTEKAKSCADCKSSRILDRARKRFDAWVSGDTSVLTKYSKNMGQLATGHMRNMFFESRGNSCERCGWTYHIEGRLPPLHISHRDNHHKNMNYLNLELLCPNCHSIHHHESDRVKNGSGRWSNSDYKQ